jgi:hypothetical protein
MAGAITGYFTTLGLSTAAGLNAYLPLLILGLLSRFTDLITLPAPWDALESPVVLGIVAAVGIIDFVGDKVPVVDHVLHVLGLFIAPVAGGIVALAAAHAVDVEPGVAGAIGVVAALATQAGRMAARPVSTATTAGAANPVVSLGEDGVSGTLSFTAIVWPVVAFVLVAALATIFVVLIRRWRAFGRRLLAEPETRGKPPVP